MNGFIKITKGPSKDDLAYSLFTKWEIGFETDQGPIKMIVHQLTVQPSNRHEAIFTGVVGDRYIRGYVAIDQNKAGCGVGEMEII